jgi:hypothetical protein
MSCGLIVFSCGYLLGYRAAKLDDRLAVRTQIIPYTKVIKIGDTPSKDTDVSEVDTEINEDPLISGIDTEVNEDTLISGIDTEVNIVDTDVPLEDTTLDHTQCTYYFVNIHISTELGLAHIYDRVEILPQSTELKIDTLISNIKAQNQCDTYTELP